jgi:hypothetical protein
LRGYKQALASNDFTFDPALVRYGNWEPSSGYSETHALMDLPSPPDAIFCANDLMALGCIEALKERGKSIPGDVSVIGFDNRDIAQFIRPPLTTLHLPMFEMGAMGGGNDSRHRRRTEEQPRSAQGRMPDHRAGICLEERDPIQAQSHMPDAWFIAPMTAGIRRKAKE